MPTGTVGGNVRVSKRVDVRSTTRPDTSAADATRVRRCDEWGRDENGKVRGQLTASAERQPAVGTACATARATAATTATTTAVVGPPVSAAAAGAVMGRIWGGRGSGEASSSAAAAAPPIIPPPVWPSASQHGKLSAYTRPQHTYSPAAMPRCLTGDMPSDAVVQTLNHRPASTAIPCLRRCPASRPQLGTRSPPSVLVLRMKPNPHCIRSARHSPYPPDASWSIHVGAASLLRRRAPPPRPADWPCTTTRC